MIIWSKNKQSSKTLIKLTHFIFCQNRRKKERKKEICLFSQYYRQNYYIYNYIIYYQKSLTIQLYIYASI